HYRKSLTIYEKLMPGSIPVGLNFEMLGLLRLRDGDLNGAKEYLQRATSALQGKPLAKIEYAKNLGYLGVVFRRQCDIARAEEYLQKAFAAGSELLPDTPDLGFIHFNLGNLYRDLGDLEGAESQYRRALAMVTPRTQDHVLVLGAIAALVRRRGRPDEAAEFYEQAITAVEKRSDRLGGSRDVL